MPQQLLAERPTAAPDTVHVAEMATVAEQGTGTVLLKLIEAGWGSKAYYPEAVLKRDGPTAFPQGTHTHWDHPTDAEAFDRPERTLTTLAGHLLEAAQWRDDGPMGPGLYARAAVRSGYSRAVAELAEVIGVSVRALFDVEQGTAPDGKQGLIATAVLPFAQNTVDFVTYAGAGGEVQALFESAAPARPARKPEPEAMRAEAAVELAEARTAGQYLEARVHMALAQLANEMFAEATVDAEERDAVMAASTAAGAAFRVALADAAPTLYGRPPWVEASSTLDVQEAAQAADTEDTMADTTDTPSVAELQAEAARNATRALGLIREACTSVQLPEAAIARVTDRLFAEGVALADAEGVRRRATELAEAEKAYIASLLPEPAAEGTDMAEAASTAEGDAQGAEGGTTERLPEADGSGSVFGLGLAEARRPTRGEPDPDLFARFRAQGMTEEAARAAAS